MNHDHFEKIYALTVSVMDMFGYSVVNGAVETRPIDHRFAPGATAAAERAP